MKRAILSLLRAARLELAARAWRARLDRLCPASRRRHREWLHFYAPFVSPGETVFDLGANLGERTRVFLELGAKVVAVEPQRSCVELLERLYGGRRLVVLRAAVGACAGEADLAVCDEVSTLATLSAAWREAGRFAARHHWSRTERVPVVTLDDLVRDHGRPVLCKIDVEGYEPQVLAGLSAPLPALSFEFTREFEGDARACVERLLLLGPCEFNLMTGESRRLDLADWGPAEALFGRLAALDHPRLWGEIFVNR